MIELSDLTKKFDTFTAVDHLNLRIETGEFFGLLGPNGAGKTTTISLMSTLLLPTEGEIRVDGEVLSRKNPGLKRKISVITQEYSMRQDMTMDEVMEYQGRLYFMPRKKIREKTEELLTRIMDTSDKMTQQITESAQKTASLGESMQAMKESMEEVNSGSNDTAEAVQSQLNQTEEIQAMVEQVEKGTENIIDSMNQNKEAIAQGNANVGILVKQAEETVESGKKVTEELSQLDTYMSQMNSILDIINSITSQTSLLALNASIEAARAGEAGRGFAVVASEISQMAQQTKDSTVQISQLIENVSNAIQMVVEVSGSMISMIESQNETTEKTAESFTVIEKNSDNVYGQSNELAAYVTKLADANKKIVDSISTISAISEEVAAHASDTLSATESNNVIVEELAALSGQLETLAQELKEQ